MSITDDNLDYAFTGEILANRMYKFFAERAEEEGQKSIVLLFRAIAEAEKVHSRNLFKAMGKGKNTKENLITAIGNEKREFTDIYPAYIKQAEKDGDKMAAASFKLSRTVEKIHRSLYQTALANLENNGTMDFELFHVCQNCGNTIEGEPPDKCHVCGNPKKSFKVIK